MVHDNIEATLELNPCTNYHVTPRFPVQDVTRQQFETLILGPIPNIMKLHIGLGTGVSGGGGG